jgi:hypothetical protein
MRPLTDAAGATRGRALRGQLALQHDAVGKVQRLHPGVGAAQQPRDSVLTLSGGDVRGRDALAVAPGAVRTG